MVADSCGLQTHQLNFGQPLNVCEVLTGAGYRIRVEQGYFVEVSTQDAAAADYWLAPSFCDIQVNGALGIDFSTAELEVEQVIQVARWLWQHGVGSFCATLVSGPETAWLAALPQLVAAQRKLAEPASKASQLVGIHLEGPWLSAQDGPRGAHPRDVLRDPNRNDWARWQALARGQIRMVTLAPERNGALEIIRELSAQGIVVALGHTAASVERIQAAVQSGAKLSTHLGNGCAAELPRHGNLLWEQLACDRLWASLIVDGHHLPESFVRVALRSKTSARLLLTSDASPLAGLPAGRYPLWGHEVEITPAGRIQIPNTPFLAGSNCALDHCVTTLLHQGEATFLEAISMASVRPRECLGLPLPRLATGATADFGVWSQGDPGPPQFLGLLS